MQNHDLTITTWVRVALIYFSFTLGPSVPWEAITNIESWASRTAWIGLTAAIHTLTRHNLNGHVHGAGRTTSVSCFEEELGGLSWIWLPWQDAIFKACSCRAVTQHGYLYRHSFRVFCFDWHDQVFLLQCVVFLPCDELWWIVDWK